jgi:ABC-2 type transport system permease protein
MAASNIQHSDLIQRGWRTEWYAFFAMVRKELIAMTRYPVQFVTSFAQVFLIIGVFSLAGLMFAESGSGEYDPTVSGVPAYGFLLFIFISDTLWVIGVSLRHEQVQGTLEQLYLSPANKFANLISRVTTLLVWTGSVAVVGTLMMQLFLGRLPFENPGLALLILFFSLTGSFGIGFIFAALTLRLKETANTLANMAQFAIMVLCANFFPFSALPQAVRYVSMTIPLAYCVDAFRSTLMGYPPGFPELAPIEIEVAIVVAFGLITPVLGLWLYQRAEDHARRTGSLGEY